MTEYNIAPGQWNFRPMGPWCPRLLRKMEYEFMFDPSAYYSLDDWKGDMDFYDINKLVGLTAMFSANNKQSALLGWRPSEVKLYIELFAYTNDKSGSWRATSLMRVPVNQKVWASINWENDQVTYQVKFEDARETVTHPLPLPTLNLVRPVTLSFGGANNSEGPYGGAAPKHIKIYLSYL